MRTDGMFAILVPAALTPLILTLFWGERQAKKLGLVQDVRAPTRSSTSTSIIKRVWKFIDQLDLIGLVILGAAVALILLPLTLTQTAKGGWHNGELYTHGHGS